MTEMDHDRAAVLALLDRYDAEHKRAAVTYLDVLHACDDVHRRAQAVLAELEGAGVLDWRSNGRIERRKRLYR